MGAAEFMRLLWEDYRVSPTVSSYTEWEKYRGYVEDALAGRIPVEQDAMSTTIGMVETRISKTYLSRDNLAAVHQCLTEMFLDGKAYVARIMSGEHCVEVGGRCDGRCIKLSSVALRISGETGLDYIVRGCSQHL